MVINTKGIDNNSKNKELKYSNLFLIYFFLLVLGYFLSSIYRPYIYSNKINDFGIADIGNNIVFIPSVYILLLILLKKPLIGYKADIIFHFIILSLMEILSNFIPNIGTFDLKDILGLFLGCILTFFIFINKII